MFTEHCKMRKIEKLLSRYNNIEPIICKICLEEDMTIQEIIGEKRFHRDNPDYMSGD